ncbi:MAG: peptidoglycan DD-metalloendopeptidase family protein [Casimicrobiaceae bacterium]
MRLPSSLFLLNSRLRFPLALVVAALLAAGCATHRPAPVEDRAVSRTQFPQAAASARAPSTGEAPLPATYTVKRGDTLHQIALDGGLDYRDLAAWNSIADINRIFPGQVLRLTAPGQSAPVPQQDATGGVTTTPLRAPPAIVESKPLGVAPATIAATPSAASAAPASASAGASNLKTSPKAVKEPYSEQEVRELNLAASSGPAPPGALALPAPGGVRTDAKSEPRSPGARAAPAPTSPVPPGSAPTSATAAPAATPATATPSTPAPATAGDADQLDWAWPARGKVIAGFSDTANLKGIDIAGTAGEAVRASAPGRVVYAGSGLRGYGKLIIIKHNATYLSAYAHNREILVKEGQQVTRGQKIAEMGNTDADQVKLHFEIRRHGKPMDPTKYLPPV